VYNDGTSVQDWLYMFPNKLDLIKKLRDNTSMLGMEMLSLEQHKPEEDRYTGPQILDKIFNADLLISKDIKTLDTCPRFVYKLM